MALRIVNTQIFCICSNTLGTAFCYTCLFQVLVKEPLGSMKPRLKEERDEEEEPDRKKVKTEEADTVEVKLESHPQVHKVVLVIGW